MSLNYENLYHKGREEVIKLLHGDCLEVLKEFDDNSIDSVVTDPPAAISFMGKSFDTFKSMSHFRESMTLIFKEVLRVLKPGAHGFVWAIPRTSHHMGMALEESGFKIRDIVHHVFGSGFPKSLNISKQFNKKAKTDLAKQWDGWQTALKPAVEHWILIRKPLSEKNVCANVEKWGTAALNIDECRVAPTKDVSGWSITGSKESENVAMSGKNYKREPVTDNPKGRFPSNLLHDGSDEVEAEFLAQGGIRGTGSASRFFYCSKASKSERNRGLEDMPLKKCGKNQSSLEGGKILTGSGNTRSNEKQNSHPCVKPIKLMEYLIKLITPPNGTVLDQFMGSGSTGVACKNLGFNFIGIEMDNEYIEIAKRRIEGHVAQL